MTIETRALGAQDAHAFWHLRLRALETEPHAFGESAEEHRTTSLEAFARRLSAASEENYVLGAFSDDRLIGTVGFGRSLRRKERHKAKIWGVFVDPEFRGQRIAHRLMSEVLGRAASIPGLEQVILTVTHQQSAARRLYASLGFIVFGHERHALKVGDLYVDEDHMVFFLDLAGPARRAT